LERLKKETNKEGSQLYEEIVQLKFEAADGKKYATDCLDTPNLLRLIQSIPSPKAEPFKQWLAKVGYERIIEIADPSQSLDRARENWKDAGIKEQDEFALLTNIINQHKSKF
jgi:DNA-damage-inducible protein D